MRALGLILGIMFLSSCYEGWEYGTGPGDVGGENPGEPTPEIKPIYYVLFQPIYMSESAANSSDCLANQAIAEYKINEWSLRIAAIQTMLDGIAENLVIQPIQISKSDCQNLTQVALQADSQSPWGIEDPPGQDILERLTIHLKVPMWEEEPTGTPSSRVTRQNWAGWIKLIAEGKRATSAHYFLISNPTSGYFSEWRFMLPTSSWVNGETIDNPDPSQPGLQARTAVIERDVAKLKTWLLSLDASSRLRMSR
jgi:hypothetical protein